MQCDDMHFPQTEDKPLDPVDSFVVREAEETKHPPEEDDDNDLKMSEDQQKLWAKIEKILDEYFLSQFQTLAVKKFIRDRVANQKIDTV